MSEPEQIQKGREPGGPDPVDLFVGRRIKALRLQKGLTQKQLAEGLGVTFQQVQKYERGGNRVSASMLSRVSVMLGCRVSSLFPPDEPDRGPEDTAGTTADEELMRLLPLLSASRRALLVEVARQFAAVDLKG